MTDVHHWIKSLDKKEDYVEKIFVVSYVSSIIREQTYRCTYVNTKVGCWLSFDLPFSLNNLLFICLIFTIGSRAGDYVSCVWARWIFQIQILKRAKWISQTEYEQLKLENSWKWVQSLHISWGLKRELSGVGQAYKGISGTCMPLILYLHIYIYNQFSYPVCLSFLSRYTHFQFQFWTSPLNLTEL